MKKDIGHTPTPFDSVKGPKGAFLRDLYQNCQGLGYFASVAEEIVRAVNGYDAMQDRIKDLENETFQKARDIRAAVTLIKQVKLQFETEAKIVIGAEKKWGLFLEEINKVLTQVEGKQS